MPHDGIPVAAYGTCVRIVISLLLRAIGGIRAVYLKLIFCFLVFQFVIHKREPVQEPDPQPECGWQPWKFLSGLIWAGAQSWSERSFLNEFRPVQWLARGRPDPGSPGPLQVIPALEGLGNSDFSSEYRGLDILIQRIRLATAYGIILVSAFWPPIRRKG